MADSSPALAEVAVPAPLTTGQGACLIAYILAITLWGYAEYLAYSSKGGAHHKHPHASHGDEEGQGLLPVVAGANGLLDGPAGPPAAAGTSPKHVAASAQEAGAAAPGTPSSGGHAGVNYALLDCSLVRCLRLEPAALAACRGVLQATVELGTILLWFYVADRTPAIAAGQKTYSRDQILFIFLILTIVAFSYTQRPARAAVAVNRQQTEEWKGWMQVLFLLYHYFNAKEIYNAIRVFIAGYVWMTGFGNFAYYYKTGDFGLGRFCQMMWRLNFLVTLCCLVLNNSYMLYYICPMHTLFTVMVYGVLAVGSRYNKNHAAMCLKLGGTVVLVFLLWDLQPVFYAMWSPFMALVGYDDPRRPIDDHLHEWYFRSSLDRYVWIHGMVCAYMHPAVERALARLEAAEPRRRRTLRAGIGAAAGAVMGLWFRYVYLLPKLQYNAVHPYTSWIPISAFLVLRNLTPQTRTFSLGIFGWLGCITLETYIGQFHTWLLSKTADGQPIYLLTLLPGYTLLNFALVTAIYVFLSFRLFLLTGTLKDAYVPHDDNRMLLRNGIVGAGAAAAAAAGGYLLRALF